MKKIEQYRERFYMLMESEMGDVKPLINEQQCTLSDSDINYVTNEVIKYFSPEVLNDDIDMMTSGFKEKITSDLVIGIWDNKINEIKTSLKAPFEKYISDLVSGTFRGGLFDINGYLYDMLNKIFVPLISEYDSSWTYKGAAKIAVSSNNIGEIQSKTKNVFLEIIDRFLVWFKLTIFKVPLRAIKIAKDFKKCDVKSNPKPFVNIPDVENFKSGNGWMISSLNDRIKDAA
jgi:hypothetical protein